MAAEDSRWKGWRIGGSKGRRMVGRKGVRDGRIGGRKGRTSAAFIAVYTAHCTSPCICPISAPSSAPKGRFRPPILPSRRSTIVSVDVHLPPFLRSSLPTITILHPVSILLFILPFYYLAFVSVAQMCYNYLNRPGGHENGSRAGSQRTHSSCGER